MFFRNVAKNHKDHFGAILEQDISISEGKKVKYLRVNLIFFSITHINVKFLIPQ
jgi:hypothetical protein